MEIWKDIKGFENSYQVSNLGRIKRLPRLITGHNDKNGQLTNERILKPQKYSNGYFKVTLSKNGIVDDFLIHRIVALHFIDNPNNLPEVNHIDEIKKNCSADNLEWMTHKQNVNHGTNIERRKNTVITKGVYNGNRNPNSNYRKKPCQTAKKNNLFLG